ncbi:MAG: hypothetical protein C5B50_21230 [Verrucomicrobia bacterium]|nr:MAG: hypothetical protein C5B50_21230 [Verrucomicrobiota bacterium]
MRGTVKVGDCSDGLIPWPVKWCTRNSLVLSEAVEKAERRGIAVPCYDSGWIVGSGSNPAHQNHAVLLTPTPYPYTISFASCSTTTNGMFQATLGGITPGSVVIESSPDLINWTPIQTNTLGTSGLNISVPIAPGQPSEGLGISGPWSVVRDRQPMRFRF